MNKVNSFLTANPYQRSIIVFIQVRMWIEKFKVVRHLHNLKTILKSISSHHKRLVSRTSFYVRIRHLQSENIKEIFRF